ncbi:uncharacterized protein EV154DRAFT_243795 [Mucor mucedo]|uniref:uncharacterized protein n=1 Tax=Mucor mucedo TaxID=29922 RepID=UPI002220D563|nr:uncharacterized protein EV154DRAFT_243795 [Mucor mucedo]KAI7890859.1 hypothetical protein EV154DRAFT_243795 [Mucor mucedo]
MYVILHQAGFLLTGLCTTLGVQWLFYRGAATSMSLLPQLSNYIGMLLVGFFIPMLLKRKMSYKLIQQGDDSPVLSSSCSIRSEQTMIDNLPTIEPLEEGPIEHLAIIKLASLDIIASFALTIGFSIIGSGMYQVIYSSIVVWCAILTWLFMGRALAKIQWVAIIGTSVGLGVSSFDSLQGSPLENDFSTESTNVLFNGTLMTLCGTFISACIYVYADTILSKSKAQPLPARVCCWMGVYTSLFTLIWISVYTLPQFNTIIQIDKQVSTTQVLIVYFVVTVANALHSWSYYELIELTGNVNICLFYYKWRQ